MNFQLWRVLGLRAATLSDIERECGPFEPARQPSFERVILVSPEAERQKTQRLVEQLRAQEPAERIVNALLLAAVRDGAKRLTIAPNPTGVEVSLRVGEQEKQHLHLPVTTLEPLVERLRSLARVPQGVGPGWMRVRFGERNYILRVEIKSTHWGERVEVAFPPHA